MMSDVNIKDLINKIDNPELKNKLLLLHELTEKYDKIESLSIKIEKLDKQLKKLEKILKSKKYEAMSEEDKEKLNNHVSKVLEYLSNIIKELEEINVPTNIDSDIDKLNTDTINDIIKQLNDIFNKTKNMLPDEVKNKVSSQLNQVNQMIQNMLNNKINQQSINNHQYNGGQESQSEIGDKLNQLSNKISDLSDKVSNSNVGPSVKYSTKKMKALMDKIKNEFDKTGSISNDDLNNLNKLLDAVKNSFIPPNIRDSVKEAQSLVDDIKNNLVKQEVQDNLKNILKGANDSIKNSLSEFMSKPNKSNLQKLIKSIEDSRLPEKDKKDMINQVKQLGEKLTKIRKDFKKSAIRKLSQAHSKLTKIEKEGVSDDIKSELKHAKQKINQNMFLPNKQDLQKLKSMLNDIKNKISNSKSPNSDELMNTINDAIEDIKNAINNLEQGENPFKNMGHQIQQPNFPNNEMGQNDSGKPMKIPMPPLPSMNPAQQHGQSGQSGQHGSSGQSGMNGQQQVKSPSNLGGSISPGNLSDMLNSTIESLQNAINQAESHLSNELSELGEVIQQYAQGQGAGSSMHAQPTGTPVPAYDDLVNNLNHVADKIKNGSYSPQDLANAINSINDVLNNGSVPDSIKPMLQGVMNGLQNLMSLQSMMNNINPVHQSLNNASNSIQNVMNSLNSLVNNFQSPTSSTAMTNGSTGTQAGSENTVDDIPSSIFNNNLVNMLNKLSSSNLTEAQRKRFTEVVKQLMKKAINEANKLGTSVDNLLSNDNVKLAKLRAFKDAIKNNLHNLKVDDELLNMAQQLDDALGDSSSGGGLAGGMFASQLHEIEQVDLNDALNQLAKMNKEWIRKYRDLFDRLISEIIELKSKEIGHLLNPHGRFIDFNATINKTIKNAGILTIVKKDTDQAIGDFLFILDASGSMHDYVELKNASWSKSKELKNALNNRLKQYQIGLITAYVMGEAIRRVGEGDYYIIVFADRMVDLSNAPLDTILLLIQNPGELNKYIGGGTNLAPVLLKIINSYMNNDMNVVLFTDTGDASVWNTFILEKLKENSKKVAVFCAGDFFHDTAEAFRKSGIPVFAFNDFEDLFELMKQYYIADLNPEQAVAEVKEYLKRKKNQSITGLIPEKV